MMITTGFREKRDYCIADQEVDKKRISGEQNKEKGDGVIYHIQREKSGKETFSIETGESERERI
jgi:hypothetical protein